MCSMAAPPASPGLTSARPRGPASSPPFAQGSARPRRKPRESSAGEAPQPPFWVRAGRPRGVEIGVCRGRDAPTAAARGGPEPLGPVVEKGGEPRRPPQSSARGAQRGRSVPLWPRRLPGVSRSPALPSLHGRVRSSRGIFQEKNRTFIPQGVGPSVPASALPSIGSRLIALPTRERALGDTFDHCNTYYRHLTELIIPVLIFFHIF